jgi:hypothetical protein
MNDPLSMRRTLTVMVAILLVPVCLPAGAGNQVEEALASQVQNSLHRSVSDYPAPHLVFTTDVEGWAWLADMSSRLATKMPDWPTRRNFLVTVQYEATRAGLDPQLVLGLIQHESNFHKYAVSGAGARGFMQVMPFWVRQIGNGGHDLFTLRTNLRYGCTILRYYLDIGHGEYPTAVLGSMKRYWSWTPAIADSGRAEPGHGSIKTLN